MKLQIDWGKLKKFIYWLTSWSEWLSPPVKCRIIKKNERSLLGKAYYFCDLKSWKIKSPLTGTVSKIYPNHAIQITNKDGLQILLDIQTKKRNSIPFDKILQCKVIEGQKVNQQTILFIAYFKKQIISVCIYIPWQPELLGRIGKLQRDNSYCFVKIHYRNPYEKLQLKNHGNY